MVVPAIERVPKGSMPTWPLRRVVVSPAPAVFGGEWGTMPESAPIVWGVGQST